MLHIPQAVWTHQGGHTCPVHAAPEHLPRESHSEYQCEFSQTITVELQHCATSSQTSRLSFARCSHYSLPYNFDFLQEGDFSPDEYTFATFHLLQQCYLEMTWNTICQCLLHGIERISEGFTFWLPKALRHMHSMFHSIYFLNQCSLYSVDHCCYCVIITGSQKEVRWQRCHDWTTTTSWVWSK